MDVLPNDVAEKMKDCAWAAAWHAANTRMGSEGDAQADKVHFNDNADEFKQKATGIQTEESVIESNGCSGMLLGILLIHIGGMMMMPPKTKKTWRLGIGPF